MTNYLEVMHLSKNYPNFQLHDISFTLPEGYIMGLIGENGSGKTTVIKLILNMIHRENGKINILGKDNISEESAVKPYIGVVFDSNCFCEEWTILQTMKRISSFYETWNKEKFLSLMNRFQLDTKKKIKALSKGMQMKLMLAWALSYDAKVLILDEPTSGLDPVSRDELLTILAEYIEDGKHSVLFSTHITSDLERAADYITYLHYGELFFTGSKEELLSMFCMVKGGREELQPEQQKKLIGVRTFSTGFEALIKTTDRACFSGMAIEPVTLEDIMIFISRKGE